MRAIEFYTTPEGEVTIKEQDQGERTLKESDTDPETLVFSWLIKNTCTQFAGTLSFAIRFYCILDDGTIDYSWGTNIYIVKFLFLMEWKILNRS